MFDLLVGYRGHITVKTCLLAQANLVHYLPISTTAVAVMFCAVLMRRYLRKRRGAHLLWWAIGVACFGAGTALESAITLAGNSVWLNKLWYVMGAVLGAYPLAQGTVFLLLRRRMAIILTMATLPVVVTLCVLVVASPVDVAQLDGLRPSGDALSWTWLRRLTPIVNGYAALFLIGGAILSAARFAADRATRNRAIGNWLIAAGALLPGIGGVAAKSGHVEALYVTELVGLLLIWMGYAACVAEGRNEPTRNATGTSS